MKGQITNWKEADGNESVERILLPNELLMLSEREQDWRGREGKGTIVSRHTARTCTLVARPGMQAGRGTLCPSHTDKGFRKSQPVSEAARETASLTHKLA